MIYYFFFVLSSYALEINTKMGFAKTESKEKILITNGVFPVEFNLQFENELIDVSEATQMAKVGDWQCTDFNAIEFINEVNAQLSEKFLQLFEPLALDLQSKDRSGRGVLATAAIGAGITLAEKLLGKAVDYLFDSRSRKTEHTVNELKASLYTIKNELNLSSLELCALGQQVLAEKINRIALDLSLSMENQIRNEIQKLYFGKLDGKYKLSACLALNEHATKFECLKVIRNNEFTFHILSIKNAQDTASIQLQVLTPILSRSIIGHRIFNLGVPMVENGQHILIKSSLPQFVTIKNEFKFKSEPKHNIIEESLLISNPAVDHDCLRNTTEGDGICNAFTETVSANYLIKYVYGYTILINFIPCSYTDLKIIDEPKFLSIGTHTVKFDLGFLTCGEERISFGHTSIHLRKHISYNNHETKFNFVEQNLFKNIKNKNLMDEDHILQQISVFPYISLRIIIIIVIAIIFLFSVSVLICFYKRANILLRRHAPPALVY